MSPKKKKRAGAAQQLIDDLLDEKTPAPQFGEGPAVIDADDEVSVSLKLEHPQQHGSSDPVFGTRVQPSTKAEGSRATEKSSPKSSTKSSSSPSTSLPSLAPSSVSTVDEITTTVNPHSTPDAGSDNTLRLDNSKRSKVEATGDHYSRTEVFKGKHEEPSKIDRHGITELKTVVKMRDRGQRPEPPRGPSAPQSSFSSPEAAMKQGESLRIAQTRITELEQEVERLRRENEQLASAGDTLSRRADELVAKCEQMEIRVKESASHYDEERRVFRSQLQTKDRENSSLKTRLEEMEGRLESNFKKIRVRERELEHRLEIVRMESMTLVSTKDKMILELKRQIDQLTHENEYAKQKSQELFTQLKEKQVTIERVVRALRIALTNAEGEGDKS